jgi:hypothetical protein
LEMLLDIFLSVCAPFNFAQHLPGDLLLPKYRHHIFKKIYICRHHQELK